MKVIIKYDYDIFQNDKEVTFIAKAYTQENVYLTSGVSLISFEQAKSNLLLELANKKRFLIPEPEEIEI